MKDQKKYEATQRPKRHKSRIKLGFRRVAETTVAKKERGRKKITERMLQLEATLKIIYEALSEIERVSCGEDQVAKNDSEGMGWIHKRIQTLSKSLEEMN